MILFGFKVQTVQKTQTITLFLPSEILYNLKKEEKQIFEENTIFSDIIFYMRVLGLQKQVYNSEDNPFKIFFFSFPSTENEN